MSKYEMLEEGVLHLRDATDEPMYAEDENGEPDLKRPMRITVYGPGSKVHAQAQNARQNRTLRRLQRKGKVEMTVEEDIRDKAEFAKDITKSMENCEELSNKGATGDELPAEIYSNLKLSFVVHQVFAYATNTSNFSPPSTKN